MQHLDLTKREELHKCVEAVVNADLGYYPRPPQAASYVRFQGYSYPILVFFLVDGL